MTSRTEAEEAQGSNSPPAATPVFPSPTPPLPTPSHFHIPQSSPLASQFSSSSSSSSSSPCSSTFRGGLSNGVAATDVPRVAPFASCPNHVDSSGATTNVRGLNPVLLPHCACARACGVKIVLWEGAAAPTTTTSAAPIFPPIFSAPYSVRAEGSKIVERDKGSSGWQTHRGIWGRALTLAGGERELCVGEGRKKEREERGIFFIGEKMRWGQEMGQGERGRKVSRLHPPPFY